MKPPKIITLLTLLLISASIVLLPLTSSVDAFETPAGLENEYQQVLSEWNNALLPASIPFDFAEAEASVSNSHYLITLDIAPFQTVIISAGSGAKQIDTINSPDVQQIELSGQVTGYFLPAGETDEEPPELSFLIGDTNYYVGGWVNPEYLVSIANSMIENQ